MFSVNKQFTNHIFFKMLCSLFWLGLGSGPLLAQSVSNLQCQLSMNSQNETSEGISLSRSWTRFTYDGAGGIDTFRWTGPGHLSPRPHRFKAIEIIDTQNGHFDTVMVNGEMILGTELGELEIIPDWFDQIVLDPLLTWERTIDDAFTGQIFTSEIDGVAIKVRTALDAYVFEPPSLLLNTVEGPLGAFELDQQATTFTLESDASTVELIWADAGMVTPNLERVELTQESISLNTRNNVSNPVIINVRALVSTSPREIIIISDAVDRLVMLQEECWQISETDEAGYRLAIFNAGKPNEIRLIADQHHLQSRRLGAFTGGGVSHGANYRHLSAEVDHVLDYIDLQNGGRDILIIRNDGRLRRGFPIVVSGNEGVDEVWLEGSAGWRFEYQNYGVVATVPQGRDSSLTLAFAPGLEVRILPTPPFLNDPALLDLPAYPGLLDEPTENTGLFITRGGFVSFSARQLSGKTVLDLKNGIENMLRLSPESLVYAGDEVLIFGDSNQDIILSDGLPAAETDQQGNLIWHIERPNGHRQRITARGISYLQYRSDTIPSE